MQVHSCEQLVAEVLERGFGLIVPAVDELYAIRSFSQQSHERLSNQPVSLKTRANF